MDFQWNLLLNTSSCTQYSKCSKYAHFRFASHLYFQSDFIVVNFVVRQGITKLEDMFKKHGKAVDDLKEIAKVVSLPCASNSFLIYAPELFHNPLYIIQVIRNILTSSYIYTQFATTR